MNKNFTESLLTLLRELWPSLERFIIAFFSYRGGELAEKKKMRLNSVETRLKAIENKERIKKELKNTPMEELRKNVIED